MHIMYGNDLRGGGGERERRGKGMGRDWGEEGEENLAEVTWIFCKAVG